MKTNRLKKISISILTLAMVLILSMGSVSVFANSSGQAFIGVEKAKQIALNDAGLKANEVSFVKAKLEMEHGRYEYDVEFYKGMTEYDYEIDAKTGRILDKDRDIENYTIPTVPQTPIVSNDTIGVEKAKSIALNDAGFTANQVKFIKAELDNDNGVLKYDVEFFKGNIEYDYEINAKTGKIIKVEYGPETDTEYDDNDDEDDNDNDDDDDDDEEDGDED